MRIVVLALTVLAVAVLSSCASPAATRSSVAREYRLDPAGGKGLVVGSITYESGLGVYSLVWGDSSGGRAYVASIGWSLWPPLGPEYDEDLKAKGGTFAVEVPAGEYKLRRWSVRQGAMIYSATRPIDIPFNVEPGRVTYLGNFHFHKSDEVSLEERAARDIPVLKSRFDAVKNADVALSIANGFSLQAIGGASQRRIDLPNYTPIYVPVKR